MSTLILVSPLSGLTDKEYRELKAESYSSLKHLLESPKAFFYQKEKPFTGSEATRLGTAVHHLLQGNKHMVGFPTMTRARRTEYAEFESDFIKKNGPESVLLGGASKEKFFNIEGAILANPKIAKVLKNCVFEPAFIGQGGIVEVRGKIDGVTEDSIVEIKTTYKGCDAESFRETVYARHYDLQAYMYQLLSGGKPKHYFIVIETSPPYGTNVFQASEEILESGKKKFERVQKLYDEYVIHEKPFDEEIEFL